VLSKETMAHDFSLLFKAVIFETAPVLELVGVTAEGMSHKRQIEASASLGLPDVGQFVDEKSLPMKRLLREILRPQIGMRVEVNVAHGGHRHAPGLERPPFPPDHANFRIIDRIAEDGAGELNLSGGERPRRTIAIHGFPIASILRQ